MVLPITGEGTRHKSMARCSRFEQCVSILCPLDPHLKFKVHVPGRPLCFWYIHSDLPENFDQIPPVVADKLPIYVVHLLRYGVLKRFRAKQPT